VSAALDQRALVEIDPEAWDELLVELDRADAYLLREYVESAGLLDGGQPTFLHLQGPAGDVVFACLVREIPGGGLDVTTPYGYGGPVAAGEKPPVERFYELYEGWCSDRGIVTTFVRFHPLFANHRQAPPRLGVELLAPTIGWRLDEGRDLLAGMHSKHRNVVRKAAAAGTSVSAVDGPADLAPFVELYEETMRRRDAAPFYFFPPAYWERLSRLGDRLVVFDAVLDGELLASALCLSTRPWLHYHLSATSERARTTGASNLLLFEAASWAQARGFTRFHLGGGLGGREDSLYEFKRRFDPEATCEAAVGKAVHDPERYAALAGDAGLDGFFPAYRRRRG
jgi:serine/alanine adding enzyme